MLWKGDCPGCDAEANEKQVKEPDPEGFAFADLSSGLELFPIAQVDKESDQVEDGVETSHNG